MVKSLCLLAALLPAQGFKRLYSTEGQVPLEKVDAPTYGQGSLMNSNENKISSVSSPEVSEVVTTQFSSGKAQREAQAPSRRLQQSPTRVLQATGSQVVDRSGNPGYRKNYPLLVAKEEGDGKRVPSNGFQILSSDPSGKCFTDPSALTPDEYAALPAEKIAFSEFLQLSCTLDLTLADLEAYCKGSLATANFAALEINRQILEDFQFVSKLGVADAGLAGDWVSSLLPDPEEYSGKELNWDADTKTCNGPVGLNVRVMTSELGFESKLQPYVLGVKVDPIVDSWTFFQTDATASQSFSNVVQVSFHEVTSDELLEMEAAKTQLFLPQLPDDFFYPLDLS